MTTERERIVRQLENIETADPTIFPEVLRDIAWGLCWDDLKVYDAKHPRALARARAALNNNVRSPSEPT